MKKNILVMLLAVLCCWTPALAGEKSNLSVLYVGLDPEQAELEDYEITADPEIDARALAFVQNRTVDFEQFLTQNFETVTVVYTKDYEQTMSAKYDVTIFGDIPRSIGKVSMALTGPDGTTREREMETFLSPEFDHASIVIADASPRISETLGYKMDWYCKCLDAHATGMDLDHPVFNTPNSVRPTIELRDTPENFFHYSNGRHLRDTMAMWRVQTEGYMDEKGFPIGMVATGYGFDDAADAEVIAGGVNTKASNAVSLGRHGNFFHWGFIASPSHLTEEAQKVFVNAVHYIALFDGQRPYSRRAYKGSSRDAGLNQGYRAVHDSYERYSGFVQMLFEEDQEKLRRKQENGEELSFREKHYLSQEGPDLPTEEEWVQQRVLGRFPESLVAKFGHDFDKYLEYYENNYEYLVPSGFYQYLADEDVAALGVSNRDPLLLHTAIRLLEQDGDNQRALGILKRYTNESFETVGEWRAWYEMNADRLYFSDVYRFKFEVAPE